MTRNACIRLGIIATMLGTGYGAPLFAANPSILNMSLDDLINVTITSVSKKEQNLSESAAAIFVITQEDIRRSGATHLAEVLRMAPGMQVSQVNSSTWRVSARGGFNNIYVNKLLVLIDGRSVYAPQFSGVFWDAVDVLLEDIERIEVIRGPGGSLWGANAVNGVVNIITRHTADTTGNLLVAGGGGTERGFVRWRHGELLDAETNTYFRAYAKSSQRSGLRNSSVDDAWRFKQTGLRFDRTLGDSESSLQGDVYQGQLGDMNWSTLQAGTTQTEGTNLLLRHKKNLDDSSLNLQFYYDYTRRYTPTYGIINHFSDIEVQRSFKIADKHDLQLGLGYRHLYSISLEYSLLGRDEPKRHDPVYNVYVNYEHQFSDKLHLIAGTKVEHNSYTGIEIQPNLRAVWSPSSDYTVWGAVSRAVRTPSQVTDHVQGEFPVPEIYNPLPVPLVAIFQGNPDLNSETVLTWETGVRKRVNDKVSWDLSAFYSRYRELVVLNQVPLPDLTNGRFLLLSSYPNAMHGDSFGAEVVVNWRHKDRYLQLTYAWQQILMKSDFGPIFESVQGENPSWQLSLRGGLNLGPDWTLDLWLRHSDEIRTSGANATTVPAYTTMDIRLAWQINKHLELSLAGKNLLDQSHPEFWAGSLNPVQSDPERTAYLQLRSDF